MLAAACSSGASSASPRSAQCPPSAEVVAGLMTAVVSAWARANAVSQSSHPASGDHRAGVVPGGAVVVPEGSKYQHVPVYELQARVRSTMSALVEVATTAPGAPMMVGTTTPMVLPDRGGPMTKVACSGPAKTRSAPAQPSGIPHHEMSGASMGEASMGGFGLVVMWLDLMWLVVMGLVVIG